MHRLDRLVGFEEQSHVLEGKVRIYRRVHCLGIENFRINRITSTPSPVLSYFGALKRIRCLATPLISENSAALDLRLGFVYAGSLPLPTP